MWRDYERHGDELTVWAWHLFGVDRKLGESDEDLRKRCHDKLKPLVVSGTGRTSSKPAESRYGATCKRCNEHNPHAEYRPDFVCYGCR